MAMLRRAIAILFVVIWLARPSFSGEPGGETARKQDNHESTELGDRIQRLGDLANVGSVTSSAANSVVLSSDLIAKLKDAIKAKIEAPFQAFNEAQQDGDLETMAKASDEWMLLLKKTKANREDPNVRFMACLADSCRRMVQLPEEHRDEIRQAFRFGTEADAFLAEKRYPEAVERGKQATAIYSKHLSESDCVAVLSRFACGRILVLAGENQLALQDLDRAVENCAGGPTGRTVFYTAMLEEQAEICRYLKEQERLLVCLRRTATAYKEVTGGQSTQHVTSLRILATELLKMESFEEAGRVCQEAFQSTEPVKASLDLARELGAINLMHAAICYKRGDYSAAAESLKAAITAAEKDRPADPETVSELYDFLAQSLDKADRSQEAEQARKQAEVWRLQIQMASEFPLPKSN